MARLTFPNAEDRLVYYIEGASDFRPRVGALVRIYSDSGATTLADIRTLANGAILNSELTVDANSLLPQFLGPDDGSDTLYAKGVGGTTVTEIHADIDSRLDLFSAQLDAFEAPVLSLLNIKAYGGIGDGVTNDGPALTAALADAEAGDIVYLPSATGWLLNGGPFTIPIGVTVQVAHKTPVSSSTDLFVLNDRARVIGGKYTGTSVGDTKLIDLGSSKSDQEVSDIEIVTWKGVGIWGVASIRPRIERISGTLTRISGEFGSVCRLTTSNVGDVVSPILTDIKAINCAGTGTQLDGEWEDVDWRTTGFKVRNPRLTRCHGEGGDWAGVFVNSTVGGVLVACSGNDNADYGVGMEFCIDTVGIGCVAKGNAGVGLSLMNSNDGCGFLGGASRDNGQHGVWVNYGAILGVGEVAANNNFAVGISVQGNDFYGVAVNGGPTETVVRSITYGVNTLGDLLDEGVNTSKDVFGDTAWSNPVYANGWLSYGEAFGGVQYRKDAEGVVHFQGLAKDGTGAAGTVLFVLPAGYRPPVKLVLPVMNNSALGRIDIEADGSVKAAGAGLDTAWVSFGGISFVAA